MPLVDFGILAAPPEEFVTAQQSFGDFEEYTQNADSWYRMSLRANHGETNHGYLRPLTRFMFTLLLACSLSLGILASPMSKTSRQQVPVANLSNYVCKDLNDLLRDDPDVKLRLRKLLGKHYQLFMKNLTVSGALNNIEGYLTMAGLAPHMGGVEEAILFISLTTGKIHCVILSKRFGGKHKVFTEDSKTVPTSLIDGILYERSKQSQFKC